MRRIIVGISGASGALYGIRTLQALRGLAGVESHLVMSPAARRTITDETDWTPGDVEALAHVVHKHADIGASLASGSFLTSGMIVAPCSIKSLSEIAHSLSGNLLTRAADVCLKERRRLVLLVRETPLHLGHLELMAQATRCGAIVMPPMPAFYARPASIEEMVDQTVGKALDLFELPHTLLRRWKDATPGPDASA